MRSALFLCSGGVLSLALDMAMLRKKMGENECPKPDPIDNAEMVADDDGYKCDANEIPEGKICTQQCKEPGFQSKAGGKENLKMKSKACAKAEPMQWEANEECVPAEACRVPQLTTGVTYKTGCTAGKMVDNGHECEVECDGDHEPVDPKAHAKAKCTATQPFNAPAFQCKAKAVLICKGSALEPTTCDGGKHLALEQDACTKTHEAALSADDCKTHCCADAPPAKCTAKTLGKNADESCDENQTFKTECESLAPKADNCSKTNCCQAPTESANKCVDKKLGKAADESCDGDTPKFKTSCEKEDQKTDNCSKANCCEADTGSQETTTDATTEEPGSCC